MNALRKLSSIALLFPLVGFAADIDRPILPSCGDVAQCTYKDLKKDTYACLLDMAEGLLLDYEATLLDWPDTNALDGFNVTEFTFPPEPWPEYGGYYLINLDYNSSKKSLKIEVMDKPDDAPYTTLWRLMDTGLRLCK